MNTHPYLRAFLAGAFVPTLLLPVMLLGFIVSRLMFEVSIPIEREQCQAEPRQRDECCDDAGHRPRQGSET